MRWDIIYIYNITYKYYSQLMCVGRYKNTNKHFHTDTFYFAKRLFLFVAKVHVDFEDNDVEYIRFIYLYGHLP